MKEHEKKLKRHLMKEASARVYLDPTPITDADIKVSLLKEAETRLAQLNKKGMAWNVGYSGLHNATWNLEWTYPDIGPKAAAIKQDIEENFAPYMREEVHEQGKKHSLPIGGGMYRFEAQPVDSPEYSDEPDATLVMRFRYRRHIKPIYNKKALQIANNATSSVSNLVGFDVDEFINDIEENNVSLNPYFHPSSMAEEKGGNISDDDLLRFLIDQKERYSSTPVDRNMLGVDSLSFYTQHQNKFHKTNSISLTKQNRSGMKFSNSEIDDLKFDSYIMRAIANKIRQGYAIDYRALKENLIREVQRHRQMTKMSDDEFRHAIYKANQRIKKIVEEFHQGMNPVELPLTPEQKVARNKLMESLKTATSEQQRRKIMRRLVNICTPGNAAKKDRDSLLHWGVQMQNGKPMYRPGLEVVGSRRNISSNLDTIDLRALLSGLTSDAFGYFKDFNIHSDAQLGQFSLDYMQWALMERDQYKVGRNEFFVPRYSLWFSPNGLDSDPGQEDRMPVIPMLRKLPASSQGDGNVLYDRDVINIGRNHLVKNWYKIVTDRSGGRPRRVKQPALAAVLHKWGQRANDAVRRLSSLRGNAPFSGNQQDPSSADVAWKVTFHNRTNAETVYEELIRKYEGNFGKFQKEVLDRSLSSVLDQYYKYEPALAEDGNTKPLLRLFANGLPDGSNADAWVRLAQQSKSACSNIPQLKSLAAKFPHHMDAYTFINELWENIKNNLPSANPLLGAIRAYQDTGNWDRLSRYIENYMLSQDQTKNTDQFTQLDEQGWDLFARYGYGTAKMMDFVSCLMFSSCGEMIPREGRGLNAPSQDEIFGRHYATSSGKGDGGQIMIGLYYAFNAEEVSANPDDPNLTTEQKAEAKIVRNMINKERGRRHDAYRIRKDHNTYRKSSHWERAGERTIISNGEEYVIGEYQPLPYGAPVEEWTEQALRQATPTGTKIKTIKVLETLQYFIGEAGSSDGMLKSLVTDSDWHRVLSEFERRFPTLQKQLNVLIMPINARLDLVELSAKRAIDNVRKNLEENPPPELAGRESAMKTTVEIILEQANGEKSVLSTTDLDSQSEDLAAAVNDIKGDNNSETMEIPEDVAAPQPMIVEGPESGTPAPPVEDTGDQPAVPTTPVLAPPADQIQTPVPVQPVAPGAVGPVEEPTSVPTNTNLPPPDKKEVSKSMPSNNTGDVFITKQKAKRSLLRHPSSKASVEDRLKKIADELDNRGITVLADKIDMLIWKLRNVN